MKHGISPRSSGFTLIELMVVVAILAVLASAAAPSFQKILAAQLMRSVSFDMVADLTLARSEAIKRGANVTIAPETGGWNYGWKVTLASNAELISQRNAVGTSVIFTSSPTSITYDQNGRISSISTSTKFALSDGARNRCIRIDPSGRPKSSTLACI